MKKHIFGFLRRGFFAAGFGPIVLAVIYLILKFTKGIDQLPVNQVIVGIFSLTALAFIVGVLNYIYQIERIPLMIAISIHGGVLYIGYLLTYLLNDWLEWGAIPILVFSAIFVVGYILIWVIIYSIIKKRAEKINLILNEKNKNFKA